MLVHLEASNRTPSNLSQNETRLTAVILHGFAWIRQLQKSSSQIMTDRFGEILQETLQLLKIPESTVNVMVGQQRIRFPVPYQSPDRVINLLEGHYLIARPGKGVLEIYNGDHERENEIPVQHLSTPLDRHDLEWFFEDLKRYVQPELNHSVPSVAREAIEERVYAIRKDPEARDSVRIYKLGL